ncbi:polyphosphate:AMP phosphotransferase [Acinetobacter kanungonis]|uniref:polyphosphate:AMP phosphotransferase n=1 Tax=Acinetobacter kanungonis TaxID=2699469 RepID=UPI00137ABAFF|nr:phosphate--AMP phosphotransferase [Acinetobacter kanungonis]NCI78305.1 phosphate--AMP phosphotransferase [Acinetobacter kanungonis]
MAKQQLEPALVDESQLSLDLIDAQYALKDTKDQPNAKSLVVLVSGIELAGKGESVKQLREWMDPRYLRVKADAPVMFNNTQTFWQPYARFIPSEGQIAVLFGNWYGDLLSTALHVSQPLDETLYDEYVDNMRAFEQDLKNNHVDVIKVWFDLSWKSLQKRLDEMDASEIHWHKLHGLNWRNKKQYERLQKLRQRFTEDWIIIDCEDEQSRDQQFAQHVLRAMQHCPDHVKSAQHKWKQVEIPAILEQPPTLKIDKTEYKTELERLTRKVADTLRFGERNVIIALEGMDAAGKGGAIKRIVKSLDPREYEIHSIAAPEKYELRHPYLWRFWGKIQPNDRITIFDRTWYGRVLVERVEGFANEVEWQRAYEEINRFEKDLTNSNTVVVKIWLSISKDEQYARFKEREETPHKRFKITPDDWRNREKWDEYLHAAADMFERTHTDYAPWYIVANDDKYGARLEILRSILKQLKAE